MSQVGTVHKTFDNKAEVYPKGFYHDVTLIEPTKSASPRLKNIKSPIRELRWLRHDS